MEYKTTASLAIQFHSTEVDVSTILDPFGFRLTNFHAKGEKRKRGSKDPYYEHYARFCLCERSLFDIGNEIYSLCTQLLKMEASFKEVHTTGGSIWLIVCLYDPEFIQLNMDKSVINLINQLGMGVAFENRSGGALAT